MRHVAIKVMHTESEEYRIVHFLSQQSVETMRESCILPVVELLYFQNACFAVMPRYSYSFDLTSAIISDFILWLVRWGSTVRSPRSHTMRGLLYIMRSVLKVRICYNPLSDDIS